jgi:multiple sugar transport system substrate-binding protein
MGNRGISRRTFLKFSAGAMAAAAIGTPTLSRVAAQGTGTLRVSMWDGPEVKPQVDEIMQGFTDKFGFTVNSEFTPDSYDTKLLAGLAAGSAPDVFLWWNYPQLIVRNGLQDLSSFISGSSPLDTSIYFPPVLNVGKKGDSLYGIPKDWTSRAMFYNKDLFDKEGIPYPTNDWTWTEFLDIAKALTKGDGPDKQYGTYIYNQQYPLQGYVWSNGGDFISPDGMTATGYLDSPATIEAIDWYIRLQTEHGVSPTAANQKTLGDQTTLFANGKLGMFDTGIWPLSQFLNTKGLNFGTVLPPKTDAGKLVTVLHQADWAINPNTTNKDGAWELLKWMTSPRAAAVWGKSGFSLPAIESVAKDLGFYEDPIRKTFYEAVDYMTTLPWFIRTTNGAEAETEINQAIQSAFLGQTSIEEALKAAAPTVDSILQS